MALRCMSLDQSVYRQPTTQGVDSCFLCQVTLLDNDRSFKRSEVRIEGRGDRKRTGLLLKECLYVRKGLRKRYTVELDDFVTDVPNCLYIVFQGLYKSF